MLPHQEESKSSWFKTPFKNLSWLDRTWRLIVESSWGRVLDGCVDLYLSPFCNYYQLGAVSKGTTPVALSRRQASGRGSAQKCFSIRQHREDQLRWCSAPGISVRPNPCDHIPNDRGAVISGHGGWMRSDRGDVAHAASNKAHYGLPNPHRRGLLLAQLAERSGNSDTYNLRHS